MNKRKKNRNYRVAAFETLLKLGELQQLVFHRHYDQELDKGNPRAGWAYVLTIRDLSMSSTRKHKRANGHLGLPLARARKQSR